MIKSWEREATDATLQLANACGTFLMSTLQDIGFRQELVDMRARGHSARLRVARVEQQRCAEGEYDNWISISSWTWKGPRRKLSVGYWEESAGLAAQKGVDATQVFQDLIEEGKVQAAKKQVRKEEIIMQHEGKNAIEGEPLSEDDEMFYEAVEFVEREEKKIISDTFREAIAEERMECKSDKVEVVEGDADANKYNESKATEKKHRLLATDTLGQIEWRATKKV